MRAIRESARSLSAITAAALGSILILLCQQIGSTPAEAAPSATSSNFRIVWGINTQVEPLADPTSSQRSQIGQLESLVDGYSLNVLFGGLDSYWPGRPYYCAINGKLGRMGDVAYLVVDNVKYSLSEGAGLRPLCNQLFQRYVGTLHGQDQRQVYFDALGRAIRNLNLASEHAAGKTVNAQTIVDSRYFSYAAASDTVTAVTVPSLELLSRNGVIPDSLFIYEEPALDKQALQVPATPGGRIEHLPNNTRLVGMIGNALRAYQHPVRELRVNVRIWLPDSPNMIGQLNAGAAGYTVGVTFEFGPRGLFEKLRNPRAGIENIAAGIAWMLNNTSNPVSLLMPAYWPCNGETNAPGDTCAQTNTEDTRTALIQELELFVTTLDRDIRAAGANTGVCTGKLSLITGGYGYPLHPLILPIYTRTGRIAGTVGGEIVELHNLRTRLCG